MILYIRQLAWYHAKPKDSELSRLERKHRDDSEPDFPPLEYCHHLVNYMQELGFVSQSEMGLCPLNWQEIKAWMEATGTDLDPWSLSLLITLSRKYLSQLNQSENPQTPAPYNPFKVDRKQVSKQIDRLFASLAAYHGDNK